jgi:hypothetical protein
MDKSWSLSYPAYLSMANTIGIDRVLFTTDYPYGTLKAARQYFDQMPINMNDKEKIAHLNAERLLGLGAPASRRSASRRINQGRGVLEIASNSLPPTSGQNEVISKAIQGFELCSRSRAERVPMSLT